MDTKDLDLLAAVRRRHRHARLNQAVALVLALVFAGLAGVACWELLSTLTAPFADTDLMARLSESNRRYRDVLERIPRMIVDGWMAVLFLMMWGHSQSERRSDDLLLKLADERERDLDVPRV